MPVTRKSLNIEISSDLTQVITISTVAANVALPSITIPTGIPAPQLAYLVFRVSFYSNTNAATNAIDGDQYIQIKESVSGSYENAIKLPNQTVRIDSGVTNRYYLEILGNIDISSIITPSLTYDIQWTSAKSLQDNLVMRNFQTILRLVYW
jgi:hypothetical protein